MAFFKTEPTRDAPHTKHAQDTAVILAEPIMPTRHPGAPKRLVPAIDCNTMTEAAIAEYRDVAITIGVSPEDIVVEEFRCFLAARDIPTFNLSEVVSYMDNIAAKDNPTKLGWHWCPVRPKDAETVMTFGRPSEDRRHWNGNGNNGEIVPSSDFYQSHQFGEWRSGRGGWGSGFITVSSGNSKNVVNVESNVRLMQAAHDEIFNRAPTPPDWRTMPSPAYTRTLPLHALKKIALIEREFGAGKAAFLVTDYTTQPHIIVNPDPFLMVVIPNSAVAHGKGRFIIDVWDEPGFGIDRMVK